MGIVGGEVVCLVVVLYMQVGCWTWTAQYSFLILSPNSNSQSSTQTAVFDFLDFWSGDVYKSWVSTTLGCEKSLNL
jgi:hypothetical protein